VGFELDTKPSIPYPSRDKKGSRKMIKGAEYQLKHLVIVLLLLAFSSVGCVHRNVVIPSSAPPDASFPPAARLPDVGQGWRAGHHTQETTPFTLRQTPWNNEEIEEDSPDESLDVFGEETEEEVVQVADPLSPLNRAMFHFNDRLYFWALKPLARGYRAVIPTPVRSGVKNFFYNLTMPIRMVSCILQGKGRAASAELARFLINSTAGVLGFGNPAKRWPDLNPSEEDLGQALASYGIGNGFYIVWPVLGPSTLRDSVGMVGEWFLDPAWYVDPTEAYLEIWTLDKVNETSFRIGDYESLKEAAIDPYVAVRNAYIQHRKKQVEE
jgi:phospholipid-binding lipoprotein MlaA